MSKMIYLETLKSALGHSILHYFQKSFFKEHVWTNSSDLVKYLRMLAIIIAFAENILIFGICESRVKSMILSGKKFSLKNI